MLSYHNNFTANANILQAALEYGQIGIPTFPATGKVPLIKNWPEEATTDPNINKKRFYAPRNIGMPTGRKSGFLVLDIDGTNGAQSIKKYNLVIPPTPAVRTPGKKGAGAGWHYYFKHPGFEVRNFTGKYPGVDLRGDGGYVILPPSAHPDGTGEYEWAIRLDECPLADLPEWLLQLIVRESTGPKKSPPERWLRLVTQGAGEGERNASITALAGHLLRHYIDPYLVLELLLLWNESRCKPPLLDDEVKRTIDSVARLEVARRETRAKCSKIG